MYLYLYYSEQRNRRKDSDTGDEPESRAAFSEGLVRKALSDYAARQELGIPR